MFEVGALVGEWQCSLSANFRDRGSSSGASSRNSETCASVCFGMYCRLLYMWIRVGSAGYMPFDLCVPREGHCHFPFHCKA